MITVLFLLIFVGVTAACWFQGLWTCAINVINMTFAALIATNYWEPLCNYLDESIGKVPEFPPAGAYDILSLWILFSISYALLRAITNKLSEHRVEFEKTTDLVGRSILSLWCGWLFLCFTAFALHTAPIPAKPGVWETPADTTFIGTSPDWAWLAFCHEHTKSLGSAENQFDPDASFTARYHDRRKKYQAN
jgi:Colicin V production protein